MPADSHVLFLTLGSHNQLPEGDGEYQREDSILARLPDDVGKTLLGLRQQSFHWLKNSKRTRWMGVPVPQLKYNQTLKAGLDLGGDDPIALYFPALRRFQGRFFQTLGLEGKRRLFQSRHHVLFLCGLYGLTTPLELIQAYDCPVEPGWSLSDIWRTDGRLTQVLMDYLHKYEIKRVFDFTAMSVRRNLIDWRRVTEADLKVLHAVGEMGAGDDLLVPFARLWLDEFLTASEEDLLALRLATGRQTPMQQIWFQAQPGRHAKGPREVTRDEWVERLERMQFGIIRFLDKVEGGYGRKGETTGKRVERLSGAGRLGKKADNLANAMYYILKLRNAVRYREHQPTFEEMREVTDDWNLLAEKVENEGWDLPAFDTA